MAPQAHRTCRARPFTRHPFLNSIGGPVRRSRQDTSR